VELDSFPQMEKTNVPNVDQVNLKPLKVMMAVAVDIVTNSSFYLKHVTFLVTTNFIKFSFDTR
jgi:hypothetical protein